MEATITTKAMQCPTSVYAFSFDTIHTRTQYRRLRAILARTNADFYQHKLGVNVWWESLAAAPALDKVFERLRTHYDTATWEYGSRNGWTVQYYSR